MRHSFFMKAPSFIAVILLPFVAVMGSWILGLSILSFALTSFIFVLTSILLIRIMFKSSHNPASWIKSGRSDGDSGHGLIANATTTIKWAASGNYYRRTEIANILRAALTSRFGGQYDRGKFASREDTRAELTMLVGRNPKVLEIFDPKEDDHRRRGFRRRPTREEEEYLSALEEAIGIVSEREK